MTGSASAAQRAVGLVLAGDAYLDDQPSRLSLQGRRSRRRLTRDEVVAYLEADPVRFDPPIGIGAGVLAVRQSEAGYTGETTETTYETKNVVVAPGPFQRLQGHHYGFPVSRTTTTSIVAIEQGGTHRLAGGAFGPEGACWESVRPGRDSGDPRVGAILPRDHRHRAVVSPPDLRDYAGARISSIVTPGPIVATSVSPSSVMDTWTVSGSSLDTSTVRSSSAS